MPGPNCSHSKSSQTTTQCDEPVPATEELVYDSAVVPSIIRAVGGPLVEFKSIEAGCSYLGLDDLPPARSVTAEHGYWITREGEVLSVDHEGHVAALMDCDEFIDLSPTQPYADWYTAAFARLWVRVVAPAEDRQEFRFQFATLTPATRQSLADLLGGPTYDKYILEAENHLTFDNAEDAINFVQSVEVIERQSTETWTG